MMDKCADCGKPIHTDDIVCDACLNILHALVRGRICAFCKQKPATHTTSADDSVCQDCYTEFEDALEGDSDD